MALLRRGKHGYYHAYYWTVVMRGDGVLSSVRRTVNLHTANRTEAEALERELMSKAHAARDHQRSLAHAARLEIEAGIRTPEAAPRAPALQHRRRRLKVADALATALRYREIGRSTQTLWRSFARRCGVEYVDELTRELIFDYLNNSVIDTTGRTYNNARSAIHVVLSCVLADAGLAASPVDTIPTRRVHSNSQRPFSEEEFLRMVEAAPEPWRSAIVIAWHTGLREKDVFTLRWSDIKGDVIQVTPAKTSRFGRGVRVPVHPALADYLAEIPRVNERVLGAWSYFPHSGTFHAPFTALLADLGIVDNDDGSVCFNSLRNSFITRCDAAGVPRHALRGIVGHTSDAMTDLYSHDITSARAIQAIPSPPLRPKSANPAK